MDQVVDEVGEINEVVTVIVIVVHLLHALNLAWVIVYHMHVVTRLNLKSCSFKKNTIMKNTTIVLLRSQTVN